MISTARSKSMFSSCSPSSALVAGVKIGSRSFSDSCRPAGSPDVAGELEPEQRHLVQDLALVGDLGRQDHVVDRDPIGGDHDQVVAVLVDLADLARAVELEIGEGGRHPPPTSG
jgi:hypothetical protein